MVTYLADADTLPAGLRMVEYTDRADKVPALVRRFGGSHLVRTDEWNGEFYQPL